MKKRWLALPLLFAMTTFAANAAPQGSVYEVMYNDTVATIDGKADEAVWKTLPVVTDFVNPWVKERVPATSFKAYHDDEYFYFYFDVEDKNILTWEKIDHEFMLGREDRVEIFMAAGDINTPNADGTYNKYMALEMDYNGNVLSIFKDTQGYKNSVWEPRSLTLKGMRTFEGYALEGKIALDELDYYGFIKNNQIHAGLYRADFSIAPLQTKIRMDWITWIDPQTENPNFHINSSFGTFKLMPRK